MEKKLLFFDKNNFQSYKQSVKIEGYEIKSITYYLSEDKIQEVDYTSEIIDLSAIGPSVSQLQLSFEQLYPIFPKQIIFVADKRFEDVFRHDFRYCFDIFEDIKIDLNPSLEEPKKENKLFKKRIIDLSDSELKNFIANFNQKLYGHAKFKEEFEQLIKTFRVFNKIGEHKVLSLFLMGESGVGKTEVARSIHKSLDSQKKLAKINFGNYSSQDALNSLIGSPRGYVGSDGGELFSRVESTDIGVILIDEFEKSNTAVFNYFLDVLENGKLTNSLGEEIEVDGFIMIFTSNISRQGFTEKVSPELRSRIDYICQFNILSDEDKLKFIQFRLSEIIKKYEVSFKKKLPQNLHGELVRIINPREFDNMRDLNKNIKGEFVNYLLINNF